MQTRVYVTSIQYSDLKTGAAAEGRGTAQKHPGTRRGKDNPAEGKVNAQPPQYSCNEQCYLAELVADRILSSAGWQP